MIKNFLAFLELSFLVTQTNSKSEIINKPESTKSLAQKTDIQPQIGVEEHICIIIKCPPFFSFVSSSFCKKQVNYTVMLKNYAILRSLYVQYM